MNNIANKTARPTVISKVYEISPKDGVIHNGISTSKEENAPQTFPLDQFYGGIFLN